MHTSKVFPIVFLALTLGCYAQSPLVQADALENFDGPAVKLRFNESSICVPRRHFSAYEAKVYSSLTYGNGSPRSATPGRMSLNMFLPELHGYTNELYKNEQRNGYDRRKSPITWVRVDIIDEEVATFHVKTFEDSLSQFEPQSHEDSSGFTTRKRREDCVGRRAGAGAGILFEEPPECKLQELKFGHPEEPLFYLWCVPSPGAKRCFSRTVSTASGIHFMYDFSIEQLPHWVSIHRGVRGKVEQWASDHACIASADG
jgi:hypothetical protein